MLLWHASVGDLFRVLKYVTDIACLECSFGMPAAGGNRFFFNSSWLDHQSLSTSLHSWATQHEYDAVVCLLVAVQNDVPCLNSTCLIPFRIRPHFSDVLVLVSLLDGEALEYLGSVNSMSINAVLDAGEIFLPVCWFF